MALDGDANFFEATPLGRAAAKERPKNPGEPQSIDDILNALDRGEIIRGDKGFETIQTRNGLEVQFNRSTGELSYRHNGMEAKAVIEPETMTVSQFELFDDAGNALVDPQMKVVQEGYLTQALNEGDLDLPAFKLAA